MLPSYFAIIGTAIGGIGSLIYIIETLKGEIKPNRVSFIMWSIAPFIAFAAQIKQGVGMESLMTFSTGFFPLCIFLSSFVNKKAQWKLTRFDMTCGALSILGLILWLITQVGNVAIFFSILADGLAAVPTIVKAYRHPETEASWPWLATSIGVVVTLLTLSEFTFANSAFIIYIFIVTFIIFALVQFQIGKHLKLASK
jgi:hypothetical protein